ncbi:MAG: DNA double-strand break repair nuclease NurA [Chloroflexota bacterium]
MLHRGRVIAALEKKAERFAGYQLGVGDARRAYEEALEELAALSRAEIEARLAGILSPGARPTLEHDEHGIIVPFRQQWEHHEQARTWARQVLLGVPTAAVDGSQIPPSKEISLPVGAVQIGWFVNPHHPGQDYVKAVEFEILAPDELADDEASSGSAEVLGFPDRRVNARRFIRECRQLAALMEGAKDAEVKPVCFFDGSLVVSFVQHMDPAQQREYVGAVTSVLAASRAHRVPLVGYVDGSYARDLVALLQHLTDVSAEASINDGALLRRRMRWGDRSAAFICAREDAVEQRYYKRVAFTYLKTTAEGFPARLDLPRWVLEEGELEHVVDVVRAECVVGNGYPYALETADAVAVITRGDRERFYRVFQEFAEKQGLPLRFSRKAGSKKGRRT